MFVGLKLFSLRILGAVSVLCISTMTLPLFAESAEIKQVRVGLLAHNLGLIASKVEHGVDLNVEAVFNEIPVMLNGQPTVGVVVNNIGYTSFGYAGLSWQFDIDIGDTGQGLLIVPFFGAAIHDGEIQPEDDRRGLGCRLVFREAIDIGWRFSGRYAISVMTDHLSHGGFCEDRNQGLDNSGVRFHMRF